MPAPVISGQLLTDYAITTEEPTTARVTITNTPTQQWVSINNRAFKLSQYSGTTYQCEIYGYQIGTIAAGSVTFFALNALGGPAPAVAASAITVSHPTRTSYTIKKVIDRLVYLCKTPSEYGGGNHLGRYNIVQDLTPALANGGKLIMPVIWIRATRMTVEPPAIGDVDDTMNVIMQLTVIDHTDETTGTEAFYKADEEIRYLFRQNPHLQIGDDSFLIDNSTIQAVKFPEYRNGFFDDEMTIDVLLKIDQRS